MDNWKEEYYQSKFVKKKQRWIPSPKTPRLKKYLDSLVEEGKLRNVKDKLYYLPDKIGRKVALKEYEEFLKTGIVMHTDGCAEPKNPGHMGIGVVFKKGSNITKTISEYIGHGSNNIAEYTAVVKGLEYAIKRRWRIKTIVSDSEVVINQVKGKWQINHDHLQNFVDSVRDLLPKVGNPRFIWVASADNIADKPSKDALIELIKSSKKGKT